MNLKVSTILLNWDGYNDTFECLNSLQKVKNKNFEIILVDNGSDNDDYIKLKNAFPNIQVIRSEINLGFSGGNNLGIKYALEKDSDFILLLNNDTVVEPDFINYLLLVFEQEKNAGIVAPQINYFDEPKKIWSDGGYISKIRASGFAYSAKFEENSNTNYVQKQFVSGCCMLIKREVFEKIGLFDDNFFLYLEDVDLCVRTVKSGYSIYVSHKSKIYHKVSNSTIKKYTALPLYYVTRNRLYFIKKNYHSFILLSASYLFFSMVFKYCYWSITGKHSNIKAVYFAFHDFIKGNMGKTDHTKFKVDK